jgi:NinB protein
VQQPKQVFRILKGDGKERGSAMNRIAAFLSRLPKDRDFKVEISEQKARRTLSQNALLWALYGDILKKGGETMAGWETSELHDYFLIEHYGSEKVQMFGRLKLRPLKRSSGLSKTEFSDHVDFVVRSMAEQGVVLRLPEDE